MRFHSFLCAIIFVWLAGCHATGGGDSAAPVNVVALPGSALEGSTIPYEGVEREKTLAEAMAREAVDDLVLTLENLKGKNTLGTLVKTGVALIDTHVQELQEAPLSLQLVARALTHPETAAHVGTIAGQAELEAVTQLSVLPGAAHPPSALREAQTLPIAGSKIELLTKLHGKSRWEALHLVCHELLHQGVLQSVSEIPFPLVAGASVPGFTSAELFADRACAAVASVGKRTLPVPGGLAATWGTEGRATWTQGQGNCEGMDGRRLASGDTLVAGLCVRNSVRRTTLVKLDAQGQPDATFGDSGFAECFHSGTPYDPNAMIFGFLVGAEGQAFASGTNWHPYTRSGFACGFAPSGSALGGAFGGKAGTYLWRPDTANSQAYGGAAVFDSAGRPVFLYSFAASSLGGYYTLTWDVRDPQTGTRAAYGRLPALGGCHLWVRSAVTTADGGVLVASGCSATGNASRRLALQKLTSDLKLDSSFGSSGSVLFSSTDRDEGVLSIVAREGGYLVLTGKDDHQQGLERIALYGLKSDGSLDARFNGAGIVVLSAPTGYTILPGRALLVDDRGRILIGGALIDAAGNRAPALWRLLKGGLPDPAWRADGGPLLLPLDGKIESLREFDREHYLAIGSTGPMPRAFATYLIHR